MSTLRALLYTDVVDSTKLADAIGESLMASLWQAHDRLARDLIVTWRGHEIEKTDGLLIIFDSAADAAAYAVAYHRALSRLEPPLKARAGLHAAYINLRANTAGDIERGAIQTEVEGIAKPIVSRTMATAMGGQTLITADARVALGVVPFKVQSHGHWRFKGLADPVEIFEVGDSTSPFVPPPDGDKSYRVVRQGDLWRPLRLIENNLPAERDGFVGRDEPLRALASKIDQGSRLISILGMGGAGKTRLAIHYAWTWLGEFTGGIWFCDLARARTPDGIFFEVAKALDVPLGKAASEVQLAHAIAGRGRCLIIFDNFEQVARHADETLGLWLDRAPHATFIVTTREVLGIAGEDTLPIGSLPTPEATSLFVRRVAALKPGYEPGEQERQLVQQLVSVLDGLPLAIELAAARTRVMSTRMLLSRMNDRFKLLWSAGRRHDRQATLRATFDWSWDLLTEAEKVTLAQLSVFEGGFTIESVQVVLDLSAVSEAPWIPDLLQGLVDKSFVRPVDDDRFDLLESIREYSAEHLCTEGRFGGSGRGAAAAAQMRHSRFFAKLTERDAAAEHGVEANNLVAACRRACEVGDAEAAVGALSGSWSALRLRGPFRAVLELAQMVEDMPGLSEQQLMAVDWVTGSAGYALGQARAARKRIEAGLVRARAADNKREEARFLCSLAEHREAGSDPASAFRLLDQALALAIGASDDETACRTMSAQGNLSKETGRLDEARVHYEKALGVARRSHDDRWQGGVLGNLGNVMFEEGRLDEAERLYEQCLSLAVRTGDRRWQGNMRCNLGMLHLEQGRVQPARQAFEEALAMSRAMGHVQLECTVLCNLGIVLEASADAVQALNFYEEAVRLANNLADRRTEGQFRGYLGLLLAKTGNADAAFTCLRIGEELLTEASDQLSLGLLLCRRAEAERLSGRDAHASHTLSRAEALATRANASPTSELGKAIASLKVAWNGGQRVLTIQASNDSRSG